MILAEYVDIPVSAIHRLSDDDKYFVVGNNMEVDVDDRDGGNGDAQHSST